MVKLKNLKMNPKKPVYFITYYVTFNKIIIFPNKMAASLITLPGRKLILSTAKLTNRLETTWKGNLIWHVQAHISPSEVPVNVFAIFSGNGINANNQL